MLSAIKQFLRSNILYQRYAQSWINDCRYCLRNSILYLTDYSIFASSASSCQHTLFFVLDARIQHPGFADRLKVFCCAGYIARVNGWNFKLILPDTFPLDKYLMPTKEDWRGKEEQLCHRFQEIKLIAYNGGKPVVPSLCKSVVQYHIYNYIGLDLLRRIHGDSQTWREQWKNAYDQMFRPTPYLESLLMQYNCFHDYTAIHIRFVNALDNFESGYSNKLNIQQQQQLIDKCLDSLSYISKNEDREILLFSDSERFLEVAQEHGYYHVGGGPVGHISFCSNALEKTIIDFFMLSRAHHIIRLTSPEVYASTFPVYASFVGQCKLWEFHMNDKRIFLMP